MSPSARLEDAFTTRLVAVPAVTRTIALLGTHTLDDLHHTVRDAHGWDDEHLHSSGSTGATGPTTAANTRTPCTRGCRAPFASYAGAAGKKSAAVPLRRLRLKPEQRIAYVFDFGDEWRVDIRLARIAAAEEGGNPRVLESSGAAPPQYPDWDNVDAA